MMRSFDVSSSAGGRESILDRLASRGVRRTLLMGGTLEDWQAAAGRQWPSLKVRRTPDDAGDQGGFLLVDSLMAEVSPWLLSMSGNALTMIVLVGLFTAGVQAVIIEGGELMRVWTPMPAPHPTQDALELRRAASAVGTRPGANP